MVMEQPIDSLRCSPRVRTSRLHFEEFNPEKIEESLVREVGLPREKAAEVAHVVAERIGRLRPSFLSAPLIREIVNVVLIEMGLEEARRRYTRVGMPVYDVTNLITHGDKENANLQHQPETIHKLAADRTFIEYALLTMPPHLADAHMSGVIHIHDLEYFAIGRPFCSGHDVRFFLRRGLVVDGEGVHTSVAGPSKHPEVAVLHAAKFLAAMQTHYAGGQGYDLFNVFLAPYMRGLPYKRVKQMAQMFIYEMSQMYVARGGQTVFSSIAVEPGVPKVVEDLPAVLPGGVVKEGVTYGDFEEEANAFFNAIIDVYLEGDYIGKPFNFPKLEVKLRRSFLREYEEEYMKVAELAAKFGTPYYLNLCPDYMPEEMHSQCCRLLFTPTGDSEDEEDFREGRMRLGSLQVVTVNLPRIAYEAHGDDALLFELLEERMNLAREVLLLKREIVRDALEGGWLPLLSMDCDGQPYLPIDRMWLNIGFIGLNEMLKAHIDEELHESKDAWRFGLRVIQHMADVANRYSEETGLRFSILQTPAESTCYRLALIDLREFGERAVVQGDRESGAVYYTNSNHVRVSAGIPLLQRILIESSFHPLTMGGAILHVWLGEGNPEPQALHQLTKNIALNTNAAYWAYTKDMTICRRCHHVEAGLQEICHNCGATGEDVEWWSRVTGYYSRVSRWNAGKRRELMDRRRYGVTPLGR